MKTINIHGKQYVEVHERLKYFRENYKDWTLTTKIEKLETITIDKKDYLMCIMKATILDNVGRVIATGTAEETKGSNYINQTSFIENCETSAWGRALANLGIGLDTSVASADEVLNAKKQQETPKTKEKLDDSKYQAMIVAIGEGKIDVVKERMKNYNLTKKQKTMLDKLIKEQTTDPIIQEELGIVKAFKEYNNLQ